MDWAKGSGSDDTGRYRIQERLRAACPTKASRDVLVRAFLARNAAQLRGSAQAAAWETVKGLSRRPDDPLSWALAAELTRLAVSAEEPRTGADPAKVREYEVALVEEVLSTLELRAESAAILDALSADGPQAVQSLRSLGVDAESLVRALLGSLPEAQFAGHRTAADAARELLRSALRLTYVFAGQPVPDELSRTSPQASQAGSSHLLNDGFVDASHEEQIPSMARVRALMEAALSKSVSGDFAGVSGGEPPFQILARAVLTDRSMAHSFQEWIGETLGSRAAQIPLDRSPAVVSYFEQLARLPPDSQTAPRTRLLTDDFAGSVLNMKRTLTRLSPNPCTDVHLMALYLARGLLRGNTFLTALGLRRSDLVPRGEVHPE